MTRAAWETTDIRVLRSELDVRVWVPSLPGTDEWCFLHAGGERAVKAWALGQYTHGQPTQWRREGPDQWELYQRVPA